MEKANENAALYVFRANNAACQPDEIDLHGLHVEEAKYYTEQRILACKERRENHLHIIVGKGIHSVNHIQKIKPAIEELCQRHGFQYTTEHNEGRILVTLPTDGGNTGFVAPGPAGAYAAPQQPQQAYYPQSQPTYAQPNTQQYQQGHQQQYQQGAQQPTQAAGWEQYNTPQNRKQALNSLKKLYYACCR